MENQAQDSGSRRSGGSETERNEPVRSRWTPKPEQILILESIFNSGMVNPPKEETVRIRKLLEKFGAVGDANVFYWFQNRRSRSRRRQRQIQASVSGGEQPQTQPWTGGCDTIQYENTAAAGSAPSFYNFPMSSSSSLYGSSSSCTENDASNDMFSLSGHPALPEIDQNPSVHSSFCPSDVSDFQYQSGLITVYINGVATEIPRGPLDMKAMFGQDFVLFHSSGVPVQVNEYGFLMQSLQHGESYFLVPRHS
ncbi:WUSCHEL-related homeobox 11-like [Olea europaea subsp. europaea]|uniref:Protein WUSCHEL n=2 Tax=Olea europaea subsp. europaea TaxID=158383 RepID=A0A8S0VH84_OLEEU|nr:WUSCHEL-related homeobox 11-like [Olea europaea subsp. europaea]